MTHPIGVVKPAMVAASSGIAAIGMVDYKGTITLGSVITAILVAAIAGFFTLRSKVASAWREEAEAERAKADRLSQELREQKEQRLIFEREQQEIRHGLKDEIAGLKATLEVEKAKHDLGSLLEKMQAFHADAMTAMVANTGDAVTTLTQAIGAISTKLDTNQIALMAGQDEQTGLLREIRDSLGRD